MFVCKSYKSTIHLYTYSVIRHGYLDNYDVDCKQQCFCVILFKNYSNTPIVNPIIPFLNEMTLMKLTH